jgi:hypothetical protein
MVSYRIKHIPKDYDLSQTKNVSQGGLVLTTNQKFIPGAQLDLTIKFPFVLQRVDVLGNVVDSKEIVKDMIYETRLSFVNLQPGFFEELGVFIKKHLNQ